MFTSRNFVYPEGLACPHQQLAQNKRQDTAVTVIFELNGRIDAQRHRRFRSGAVLTVYTQHHFLSRADFPIQAQQIKCLCPVDLKGLRILVLSELERQYAHSDEVRAVYSLK